MPCPATTKGCAPRCNSGGPGNPLSDEGLARKFHDNAVRSSPRSAGPSSRPERSFFLTLRASRISPRFRPRLLTEVEHALAHHARAGVRLPHDGVFASSTAFRTISVT